MRWPFTQKTKPVNILNINGRSIDDIYDPVPIGDWYTTGGRTISITEQKTPDGDMVGWVPLQNSISNVMSIYTPSDLYELLHWEKTLKAVYYTPADIWRKLNTGLMFGLIALLLFFAYLIYSNQTGGG